MPAAQPALQPEADTDPLLIPDINYTRSQLIAGVEDALNFHAGFLAMAQTSPDTGLLSVPTPEWAPRLLQKKGHCDALIEKIGSLTFTKRRPDDLAPFDAYVRAQYDSKARLLFRVAFGPLKNVNCCDHRQSPDLAEFLAFIQLARLMAALAPLYPYGLKVQLVPDDLRARKANLCPVDYTQTYIAGLQSLAENLSFDQWLSVEDSETRLYQLYEVEKFQDQAGAWLDDWQRREPERYEARWHAALENAGKNVSASLVHQQVTDISSAARRYLVAHQAEILSGMWSPRDAFPLIYANHPNAYQIYSLGCKKSKLPWQICLPLNLLEGTSMLEKVSSLLR